MGASTGIDANSSGQVFRKSFPMVLACSRQLATFLPVRLAYDSNGYLAGTVLARNTTSGYYQKYALSGPSGTGKAACVLFSDVLDASASENRLAQGVFSGRFYQASLVGLDAGAITDLGAKSVTDASGTQILFF